MSLNRLINVVATAAAHYPVVAVKQNREIPKETQGVPKTPPLGNGQERKWSDDVLEFCGDED